MSTIKVNKIYTNRLNSDIVRLIIDKRLTKTMDKAIIGNNNKGMSLNISQMKEDLSAKPRHLIQVVNRRTGLSSDVIRVWEKISTVVSQRNDTNRRLYSDKDIDKLTLQKRQLLQVDVLEISPRIRSFI